MKKMTFVASLLLLLFANCQPDNASKNNASATSPLTPKYLEGNWIARDFVSKAAAMGSVVKQINNEGKPYAFGFTFSPLKKDSVVCYSSLKFWTLPYAVTSDSTLEITLEDSKKIYMQFDVKGKTMTLFDPTPASGTRMDGFVQTREKTVNGYQAFATALNHNLFGSAGFLLPGAGKTATSIGFLATGAVRGLPGYDMFQVCPGGDCLMAGPNTDALFLGNSKTQIGGWFAFRYSTQMDTLVLYRMKNERPDVKGGFVVQQPAAFTLLRVRVPQKAQ